MPITRKQFELGIDSPVQDWMNKLYDFLAARKEQAFAEDELADELNGWDPKQKELKARVPSLVVRPLGDFKLALEKLVETRAVGVRRIKETAYYSHSRPLEL